MTSLEIQTYEPTACKADECGFRRSLMVRNFRNFHDVNWNCLNIGHNPTTSPDDHQQFSSPHQYHNPFCCRPLISFLTPHAPPYIPLTSPAGSTGRSRHSERHLATKRCQSTSIPYVTHHPVLGIHDLTALGPGIANMQSTCHLRRLLNQQRLPSL